jgi:hypothetical protein
MKMPFGYKLTGPHGQGGFLQMRVSVYWWAWPIIIFKTIRHRVSAKWYMWPVVWLYMYPKVCLRLMRGGAVG